MVTTLPALVTRTVCLLDTKERRENMLFLVGKDLEACGHHDSPQKNTFLRVVIMVKVY